MYSQDEQSFKAQRINVWKCIYFFEVSPVSVVYRELGSEWMFQHKPFLFVPSKSWKVTSWQLIKQFNFYLNNWTSRNFIFTWFEFRFSSFRFRRHKTPIHVAWHTRNYLSSIGTTSEQSLSKCFRCESSAITSGTEAWELLNSDDDSSSFEVPINFYYTILLQGSCLKWKVKRRIWVGGWK